jgi:hypothetical protein
MLFIVYSIKDNPLMTMGDAVASFLDERDVTTASMGLMSLRYSKKGYLATKTTWDNPRPLWKDATSKKRRTIVLIVYSLSTPHFDQVC